MDHDSSYKSVLETETGIKLISVGRWKTDTPFPIRVKDAQQKGWARSRYATSPRAGLAISQQRHLFAVIIRVQRFEGWQLTAVRGEAIGEAGGFGEAILGGALPDVV